MARTRAAHPTPLAAIPAPRCPSPTSEPAESNSKPKNEQQPQYRFPGLVPGDRWYVTAVNWLRAHREGCGSSVVLASTEECTLEVVPPQALREHAVDAPDDLGNL